MAFNGSRVINGTIIEIELPAQYEETVWTSFNALDPINKGLLIAIVIVFVIMIMVVLWLIFGKKGRKK